MKSREGVKARLPLLPGQHSTRATTMGVAVFSGMSPTVDGASTEPNPSPPWPDAGLRPSAFRSPRAEEWTRDWIARVAAESKPAFTPVRVQTSLGTTHLLRGPEADSGKDVIAFPGFGTNAAFWCLAGNVEEVARVRRVWIADVPGHPGLSAGWAPSFGKDGYARWVEEVMGALGLEQSALMGVSLGAMISVLAAARLGDRIDRVALLAPAGLVPPVPPLLHVPTFLRFRYRTTRPAIEAFYRHLVLGPRHSIDESVLGEIHDFFEHGARGFANRSRLPVWLSAGTYRRVSAAVALIVGEDDPVFSPALSRIRAERVVPRLEVSERIAGEGHGLELSQRAMEVAARFLED